MRHLPHAFEAMAPFNAPVHTVTMPAVIASIDSGLHHDVPFD
jgi:hypothetical protein